MKTEHEQIVGVFCDVLENQAFMFGEPVDGDSVSPPATDLVIAMISFRGPRSGRLEVAVSREMCGEIAANVLGVDPGDVPSEADQEDALKELLNVVCGHFLTELGGPDAVFDLSTPAVRTTDGTEWASLIDDGEVAAVLVDEHTALLRVGLEDEDQEGDEAASPSAGE